VNRLARILCGALCGFAVFAPVRGVAAAKDERWLRVGTEDFTIITSLREKEAQAWAAEFAQYIAALRNYFHADQLRLSPLTVVVFARERDFERYRPLDAKGKPLEVAGFFSRPQSWAVAGLAGAGVSEEVRRTIFHEGVHWFLSGEETVNPVWLEEGLAEVFSTFRVNGQQAEWGHAIEQHVGLLRRGYPEPLERLLFTGHDALFGDDDLRTSMVYAQSWAFVHFLIYGQHGIPRRALSNYTGLVQTGIKLDEAFRQAFGKSYGEMDRLLAEYLRGGRYFVTKQPLATVPEAKMETATAVEVQDALARLALAGHRYDLAVTHARAVTAGVPDDPRSHEVLGLALKLQGDEAGARVEYALAVKHGSKDFLPYFELACAAQNAGIDSTTGSAALSAADARGIANSYERAINLNHRHRLSYENLAGVIGLAEPWGEQDRKFLELGRKLFPSSAMIRVGLAILARRAGDKAESRIQLDAVLAAEADVPASARAYARRLDAAWEQEDIFGEISRLSDAQKYREALALIDQHLERGVSQLVRTQLVPMRGRLESAALGQEVQKALEEQRWVDARQLLDKMIASDAPVQMKTQAKFTLADLDRKKLGLNAADK
jgi:hypothetical protein